MDVYVLFVHGAPPFPEIIYISVIAIPKDRMLYEVARYYRVHIIKTS